MNASPMSIVASGMKMANERRSKCAPPNIAMAPIGAKFHGCGRTRRTTPAMTSATYARTTAGLVACYVAAIPFFGNTVASDALFTALLFGLFAVSERSIPMFART